MRLWSARLRSFLAKRFAFFSLAGGTVGVYVSERSVYVADAARTASGLVIRKSGSVSLAETGRDAGDPEAVAQAARAAIERAGIASKKVALALRGRDTFLRFFDMPLVPRREWKSAVDFEARKYAPFPLQEIECAFKISQDRIEGRLKVVFCGIQRDLGAAIDAAFKRQGLEIERSVPPVVPLVNLIPHRRDFGDEDAVLLARLGEDGSLDIVIAKREVPLFARHSVIEGPAGAPRDFAVFLAEIRMSLDYFRKYFKSDKIRGIFLCAGADAGWAGDLGRETGLAVEPADPAPRASGAAAEPAGVHLAALAADRPFFWQHKLVIQFATTKPHRPPLIPNLPPDKEKKLLVKIAGFEAGVAALVVCVAALFLAARGAILRHEAAALAAAGPASARSSENLDALRLAETEIAAKNAFLARLIDDRVFWTAKMNAISKTAPGAVRLSAIEYEDGVGQAGEPVRAFRIEGYLVGSPDENAVAPINRWAEELARDAGFTRGFQSPQIASLRDASEGGAPVTRFVLIAAPAAAGLEGRS